MELKPYQQQVINDLDKFLEYLNTFQDSAKAFNQFWEDKVGKYQANLDGSYSGMRPYKNNIPGATHIAIKVPTAGGKTFIACNALHSIFKSFDVTRPKAVVWLVPWSNLLQQTAGHLSNPTHPYREKLNALFGNRVEVFEKEELLQGAGFNPTSAKEQLNIFVFNFSSIRINSTKKDDRKVYEQNGALEQFRGFVDKDLVIDDTDETALINVIRSLNPVVVVDESHNAESVLSVEMLNNLNPSVVLDLTATPKENSNIISFVNAMALKKEHMVKLPVIVYNHHKKEEVITSALHLQRQLELLAIEEEKVTGKYIRPIILFQAQSNIKGKDNTTYIHIKEQLTKLRIPEEQIKIKVSGLDELKGINLMAKDCEVRYIITVNALKEGWDCPNAYILASLADKSSAVDVEQILGRVLRQPHVTKHQSPLLNLSFVLSASSKFQETLDNIVKALQDSGFSKEDYYAEEEPEVELTNNEVLQQELFGTSPVSSGNSEDGKVPVDEINIEEIDFDPNVELDSNQIGSTTDIVKQITQKGESEGKSFEQKAESYTEDNTDYLLREMGKQPKKYRIEDPFVDVVNDLAIPQFYRKVPADELHDTIMFEELKQEEQLLNRNSLLKGFKLASKSTEINFDDTDTEVFQVDYNESKHTATKQKVSIRAKAILVDTILSKPKETQIKDITQLIVRKLGDMTPISHEDITKYVTRVFEDLHNDQIRDIINNEFLYISKIKAKVKELESEYAREQFQKLLDTNNILVKPSFKFPNELTQISPSSAIDKSLYEAEASMNGFEQEVIMNIASLENVLFWHRNIEKRGFALNGFESNHYPDFIIFTRNGNLILIETKGDYLDNDESRAKNLLGKKWAEKAGDNFKYFMVFQKKEVPGTYTAQSITEIVRML
ncbi:DEAD/DEAH box helicase [Carboxylicivirga caseinilyticus]|uniref:DEAD/DEAH box helicase n=1 Tax=Carboxylicivirga caseinilyticus TaxID=3417572 RepID=UPI000CAF6C9C|nr:DEAD/DEAH box helicase family protein [Marinilabiliaceae bacterium A049]PKP08645.1 MAG: restriction endonuclease [Bacteroidetes bacterium HGW-Bacteroidetes-4]